MTQLLESWVTQLLESWVTQLLESWVTQLLESWMTQLLADNCHGSRLGLSYLGLYTTDRARWEILKRDEGLLDDQGLPLEGEGLAGVGPQGSEGHNGQGLARAHLQRRSRSDVMHAFADRDYPDGDDWGDVMEGDSEEDYNGGYNGRGMEGIALHGQGLGDGGGCSRSRQRQQRRRPWQQRRPGQSGGPRGRQRGTEKTNRR
eukprot:gene10593-10751_t